MRKVIFNLHLYVALIAGAFIFILGLTGSIMAFEPELDHLLHRHRSYVKPAGSPLSLAEISTAVSRSFPGERIGGYVLSTTPDLSFSVLLEKSGAVYLNQYTERFLRCSPMEWSSLTTCINSISGCYGEVQAGMATRS